MFWRVASGIANSDQEVLLSKDNVSLDDLLSAPYIVQVYSQFHKFQAFLKYSYLETWTVIPLDETVSKHYQESSVMNDYFGGKP